MTEGIRKFDFHMHTTVSDGTDTPAEILDKVVEKGIDLFAVTDHDAIKGCKELKELVSSRDVRFVCGAEFSCKDEGGKYHILGYNYDPDSDAIVSLVEKGHKLRLHKLDNRLAFLKSEFGFEFPKEDIDYLYGLDNPGKPHIGNTMVKLGFAPSKEVAIKEFINKKRFATEYLTPGEAIEAIKAAGGIPVLAHPCYGSGDQLILGFDLASRVQFLMDMGLQGLEAHYSGFAPKLTASVISLAKENNLYITAGSDYHGKNKMVELGDVGAINYDELEPELVRFIEAVV
ncbi:PHP domain-containing protein [Butyrivibrio proteoclasticus]|uniref:PHP domain-containing protein n=1 Tax=Butyrivibrio proteoclasticus TaxID=43305 RepID=UPI00047A34AE|nr:PHP domain-containing protein [Butyrivibrio proteoclasticus]